VADGATTTWLFAAAADDIWEGEMRAVSLGSLDVLLCNVEGEFVAYDDRCPHLAHPLSQGVLSEHVLTCAAHEWVFDARTGHGVNPARVCLRSHPVRVDDDRVFVGLREDP
jgi:toluene monooxygenase system ferredoxin subunit